MSTPTELMLTYIRTTYPNSVGRTRDEAFHVMWDELEIPAGTWNGRCYAWLKQMLGANCPATLNGAMAQFGYELTGGEWEQITELVQPLIWNSETLLWNDSVITWN